MVKFNLGYISLMMLMSTATFAADNSTEKLQSEPSVIRAELHLLANGPFIKEWQKQVGAVTQPAGTNQFTVKAKGDGQTVCTKEIQSAIDACAAAGGGVVEFKPGTYVTGSLFLKSKVNFHVAKGVTLLGALDDDSWPVIHTRVAGIETDWRAAMINVRGQDNVAITGEGTLNARGKRFWDKFLNALPEYDQKNLRWAIDYDIMRPHMVQIYESRNVTLQGLTLENPPFWTVHVVFCKNVTVEGVTVRANLEGKGPSTDGVNLDSSAFCLVQNCDVDNNDDDYSFKSGMNADGLRVNLPCQYCLFRNNIARSGFGVITLGSDMSGGIQHVEAYGMRGIGTREGIRFKSAKVRGGVAQDAFIHDVTLENVGTAISINLNWFPTFSYPVIPAGYSNVPPVWKILATKVPTEQGIPHYHDITISDVKATGSKIGIKAEAYPDAPIERIALKRVNIEAQAAGSIQYAKNWTFEDVRVVGTGIKNKTVTVTNSVGVTMPAGAATGITETNWVSEMPPAGHPQLVYWFWQPNTLVNAQYLLEVERMAKDSPFTFTFLTDRGVDFYDFAKMHDSFAKTVAAAHQKQLKVGLQLWEKPDSKTSHLTTAQAVALVSEGKIVLDAQGHAECSLTTTNGRGRTPFQSELLKAYAFQETAPGFYAPESLQDISRYAKTLKSDNTAEVKVVVDAPAALAGKTLYLLAVHYYNHPDLFGDVMINNFQDALQHYADIPFDGTALDEFGWMMIVPKRDQPFRDRIYGQAFAAEYQRRTGTPLERALFDMRFAPAGEPALRMRAINHYFEVLRDGPLRVEQAFRQSSQKIFGPGIFSGIHDTYHNSLVRDDIWRTGLNWWNLPRDYGQSDEGNFYPLHMGLLVAHKQPVEINQFYNRDLNKILSKAVEDARFGVRMHYHAWNDTGQWGKNIGDPEVLSAIKAVEEKIRLLNQFDPAAPQLPILVVFGMPALLNWYPDEAARSDWDINGRLGIEEKAKAIWQAGYPCAMVPSDLIDQGQITLDAGNHPVINGHRFQAVVYLYPQYAKVTTLDFMERYCQQGGKLMLEGDATNDFDGADIAQRFDELSAVAMVHGFDVKKLSQLGVSPNQLEGGAFMEDDAVVFTDFNSLKSGKPLTFNVTLSGHSFSGTYVGVCALKVNAAGKVEKFACGGFTQLRCDDQIVFSVPQPADTVIRLGNDGNYQIMAVRQTNEPASEK